MMDLMKALLIVAGMAAGLVIPLAASAGADCVRRPFSQSGVARN